MKLKFINLILIIAFVSAIFPTNISYAGHGIKPSQVTIYSYDKKVFLGTLSLLPTDRDSVFNPYGKFGNKYSMTSLWNQYGTYGSDYSNNSAWNPYAQNPPVMIYKGKFLGYISTNPYLYNYVPPVSLNNFATGLY